MSLETAKMRPQHEIWNDLVGDAWVRHADVHDLQAGVFGDAAMAALGSVAGASVLDVGCGTGATTEALADADAREVLGVDLSEPMIAAARAGKRRPNVRFESGDVLERRERSAYDVIFSRFGVMFFDDPVVAFGHLRTLARPDGRLGFCCWGPPFANQWMALPVMATTPVLGPPTLAAPGEPGPFSLPSAEVIGDVLDRAGWSDIVVEELTLDQAHPAGNAAAVSHIVIEFSPPIVEGLRRHPERRDETVEAIADALLPFERDGVVHLHASACIVTARV